MSSIPTVVVVHPFDADQPMTINAASYDPAKHTLWSERATPAAAPTAGGQETAPAEAEPEPKRRGRPRRG